MINHKTKFTQLNKFKYQSNLMENCYILPTHSIVLYYVSINGISNKKNPLIIKK